MAPAAPSGPLRAVVLRSHGDPFEADLHEGGKPPTDPRHLDILHQLFYKSEADLGALVRLGETTYICTRAGWRVYAIG